MMDDQSNREDSPTRPPRGDSHRASLDKLVGKGSLPAAGGALGGGSSDLLGGPDESLEAPDEEDAAPAGKKDEHGRGEFVPKP